MDSVHRAPAAPWAGIVVGQPVLFIAHAVNGWLSSTWNRRTGDPVPSCRRARGSFATRQVDLVHPDTRIDGRKEETMEPMESIPGTSQQIAAPAREPSRLRKIGREVILWFRTLASAAAYATLIVTFGFQVARVEGRSMEPTLQDQDRLVVNKLAYRLHDPEVGDVVMLLRPDDPGQSLVKRVVAAPGDTVALHGGAVLRNGVVVQEDFVAVDLRSSDNRAPLVIPAGFYFVLGDHRNNSSDSRDFGPVPKKYILGRIQFRWWPFGDVRTFEP